jgi:putative acetyltransferase
MSLEIRPETVADRQAIHAVHAAAFPTAAEADLVDRLRESVACFISLVASRDDAIIGHILFTPVALGSCNELKLKGLGPMAVTPGEQRSGVGTLLVNAGLRRCREAGSGAVCVLGHPEFYPRFGFRPATHWQITSEYDVPADVFMLAELQPGYLRDYRGVIRYAAAFAEVSASPDMSGDAA